MKRTILTAATAALIAIPASAEPFRDFTDVRTRAAIGTTVIRAFPNATTPSFRLLLERQGPNAVSGAECVVWIEFLPRAGTINHFGAYGKLANFNRRALAEGPLQDDDSFAADHFQQSAERNFTTLATSYLPDEHWVATKTNDALHLIESDAGLDANGSCVAGTRTEFTANLAYRDVVDSKTLSDYGQERLRGFPGPDPSFTLFVEFAQAGTEIPVEGRGGGGEDIVLTGDACIMWLEFAEHALPIYAQTAYEGGPLVDLLASGQDAGPDLGLLGQEYHDDPLTWKSLTTGEALRLVEARVSLTGAAGDNECEGRARLQFAPQIARFYR
jgi:hypothetical protein